METRPLATLLRELRTRQGTSLRGAARDLGVDPSYLSRLERGQKSPSGDMLHRASNYYDIPFEELERAQGALPDDVVQILRDHPELVEKLRAEYGSD